MTVPICLLLAALAVEKNDIEFAKPGGVALTLDASIPEGKGPFAAVIVVHGGGWENGTKRSYDKPLLPVLTDAGFAWFTINYRLAPQHKYPAAVEDVEAAVRWVKAARKGIQGRPEADRVDGRVGRRASGGHGRGEANERDARGGGRRFLWSARST